MINRNLSYRAFFCATIFLLLIPFGYLPFVAVIAQSEITVIHFDPPNFSDGQVVTSISGVSFPSSPIIFAPNVVTTFSPPFALHSAQPCNDKECTNQASQLPIQFSQDVSAVSIRIGNEDTTVGNFCFPEGTTCPTFARLVGFNASGMIVADSGDVFITDWSSQFYANIAIEIDIKSPAANIRSATLYVGENSLEQGLENHTVRAQIDELTFTISSGPAPTTPEPPTITLTAPLSGQPFSFPYQIRLVGNVTAGGGLVAFCTAINTPTVAINDCRQRRQVQADGSFNTLFSDMSALQPSNNILYAFVYDSFGQMGRAQVPITLQTPQAPTIQIFYPKEGEQYTHRDAQVYFWGEINAPGGLSAFCTRANQAAIPPLEECTQISDVSNHGSFGVPIDASALELASNTLYAFAYDRWGQTGVGSVQFSMPTDLRITAMEITQGIQTEQLPLNTNGIARYSGVTLVYGGKTVVRLFVNAIAGGPFLAEQAKLCTVVDKVVGTKVLASQECIFSDNRSLKLVAGGDKPTLQERADPNSAFVFTLPPSWTRDYNRVISLTADFTSFGTDECPGCENNNTFTVTDVNFVDRDSILISPIELIWKRSDGKIIRPSAPSTVFSRTVSISPLAEGQPAVQPYHGTIDITDLIKNNSCNDACVHKVFNRVADVVRIMKIPLLEKRNLDGYIIGVSRDLDIGLEAPITLPRLPFGVAWEPIAIVSEGSRPLTNVTHEFYHQLAYYHAGLSCPTAFPTISWPPDDRGLIQGIGLDRRPGSGSVPGTYKIIVPGVTSLPTEYFDLMSYCTNGDSNAWISVRNWNAFGSPLPNGLTPDDTLPPGKIGAPAHAAAAATPTDQQTLWLVATTDGAGTVDIISIQQGSSKMVTSYQESPYQLILRDETGNEISRSYLTPLVGHVHGHDGHLFTVSAEVLDEGAASLEIMYNDEVVAARLRSSNTPEVTVLSPKDSDSITGAEDVLLRWEASDADGDLLEARIEYSADDGQNYRVLTTGVQGNQISLPARLFSSSDQARIRITVNDGFNDTIVVSDPFTVEGFAPQVQIIEPLNNMKIYANVGLRLVGQAFDDNGQILIDEELRWFIGDEQIGAGSILDGPTLVPGKIEVRLEGTDSQGRTGTATVNVEVLEVAEQD